MLNLTMLVFFIDKLEALFFQLFVYIYWQSLLHRILKIDDLLRHSDTDLILLPAGLSKTHEVWLIKHLKFKLLAIRSIIAITIGGGVGIYMAMHGYGLNSLIAQQLITAALSGIFIWMTTNWRPKLEYSRSHVHDLFKFSKHLSFNAVIAFLGSQTDVFLTSYYLGSVTTGILNVAKRLLIALQAIASSSLHAISLPILSECKDTIHLKSGYLNAVRFTSALTIPLFCGFSLYRRK